MEFRLKVAVIVLLVMAVSAIIFNRSTKYLADLSMEVQNSQLAALATTPSQTTKLVDNGSFSLWVTPKEYSQNWKYEIGWDRKANKSGSIYVNGKALMDPAPSDFSTTTDFVFAAGSSNKIEFYTDADKTGTLLARKYFTAPAAPAVNNPSASSCGAPATNSFTACFYYDKTLTNFVFSRNDSSINFSWGGGSPDPKITVDNFSAKWEGNFTFEAASYVFSATADDGVRLYVDDVLVIDQWKVQAATTYTATKSLTAGTHKIKMEYFENGYDAVAKLSWAKGQTSSAPATTTPVTTPTNNPPPVATTPPPATYASNIPSTYPAPLRVFEVGPGKQYESFAQVPLATIKAGDMIKVYYRSEPYREKFVIGNSGTAQNPIVITGVLGPNGERPIIDGENAKEHPDLDYWNMDRGIIKLSGSSVPADKMIKYVFIENLEIRNARLHVNFIGKNGLPWPYESNAAAIYVEKGENIVIKNCDIHDNGDGIFIASTVANPSRNILIQGNYIHDNSYYGDGQHHNVYVSAYNMIFEYNYMKLDHDYGTNIKDRSAGLTVRYNWIEGGNRVIDAVNNGIVDAYTQTNGTYPVDNVYGNVFVKLKGYDNDQIIHWGGDTENDKPQNWRKRVNIFNNTFVIKRPSQALGFWFDKSDFVAEVYNNVFYATSTPYYGFDLLGGTTGAQVNLRNNWIFKGTCSAPNTGMSCSRKLAGGSNTSYNDLGGNVYGDDPMFIDPQNDNFGLKASSPLIDAGVSPGTSVSNTYIKHLKYEGRINIGTIDIGAYEKK